MKRLGFSLIAAGAAIAALSAPANAAVTVGGFTLDTGSFGTGLGVHSLGTQSGTTLNAAVNTDGSAVTFSSTGDLTVTGSGEATVYPLTGSITDLNVAFAKAWDNITFSFAGDTGTFSLLVNGSANFGTCAICTISSSGQNKFTLSGLGISNLAFTFDPGIDTAKQFRVEGVSAIPEPMTWALMVSGLGVVGMAMRRRRTTVNFA